MEFQCSGLRGYLKQQLLSCPNQHLKVVVSMKWLSEDIYLLSSDIPLAASNTRVCCMWQKPAPYTILLTVHPLSPKVKLFSSDILNSVIGQKYNMTHYCRNLGKLCIKSYLQV